MIESDRATTKNLSRRPSQRPRVEAFEGTEAAPEEKAQAAEAAAAAPGGTDGEDAAQMRSKYCN